MAAAAKTQGEIRAARVLPEYPDDCRRHAHSGVRRGDRADTALLKTDAALLRQWARTDRCAAWYDDLAAGMAAGPQ